MTAEKQTALVTGASGTIGAAIAQALAAARWRVAVHYHQGRQAADGVVESIAAQGGEAAAFAAGLTDRESAAALFQQVEARSAPSAASSTTPASTAMRCSPS